MPGYRERRVVEDPVTGESEVQEWDHKSRRWMRVEPDGSLSWTRGTTYVGPREGRLPPPHLDAADSD
jgi:hypothetical protein